MKKTIVLVILAVFFGSIGVIGIFGSSLFSDPDKVVVKVDSITFEVEAMKDQLGITIDKISINNEGMTIVQGKRTLPYATFRLKWKINPEEATVKDITIIEVSNNFSDKIKLNLDPTSTDFGTVLFAQDIGTRGIITLQLKSNDGSEKTNSIKIVLT